MANAAINRRRFMTGLAGAGAAAISGKLLARANASGEMFISHAAPGGRYVLRLAIGNPWTTDEDVRRAWDVLREEGA